MKKLLVLVLCAFIMLATACSGQTDADMPQYDEVWQGFDDIESHVVRTETVIVDGTQFGTIYKYDKNDREIIRLSYIDMESEKLLATAWTRYNSDGSCVQKIVHAETDEQATYNVINASGQTVSWYDYIMIEDVNTLMRYSHIEYPDKTATKADKQVIYLADGTEIYSHEIITDKDGNQVTTTTKQGTVESIAVKNEKTFTDETTYYNADGTVQRVEKADFENGRMSGKTTYDGEGNVTQKQIIIYNDAGAIIGYDHFDGQGKQLN